MNSSIYRFTLDLHSTQSQISLPVTKGDTARAFLISLSDGGLPYTIEEGCLAMISIKRPTGTYLEAFCAIVNSTTIKYDFEQNPNTAALDGIHDCSVTIYDTEERKIASPRFTMIVSDMVVNSDDLNITDEDQTLIDAIIQKENERQQAEWGRVEAEVSREENEEARKVEFNALIERMYDLGYATKIVNIKLAASAWQGDEDPYSQVVTIDGVTPKTKVDLLPDVEQLAIFHDKDIAFVTENDDGVVTVYAIGDKPTQDYTMQASLKEVET